MLIEKCNLVFNYNIAEAFACWTLMDITVFIVDFEVLFPPRSKILSPSLYC